MFSGRRRAGSRRLGSGLAVGVVAVMVLGSSALAAAPEPPSPTQWPDNQTITARLQGAANAVRYFGPDRYQTSLALALALRGDGSFPFDTPDPSSNGAATLGDASGWWGPDACPRAVIVVAGDAPADALSASVLSDPTGSSSEPFLERVAAADPLFDPIGGFARVDTDSAPILVTRSARQGANALTAATRLAAQDLRSGGCASARQAIIVGGPAAVPDSVAVELVSIGYDEVFRVAGEDRYGTAAGVARSVGTAGVPAGVSGCLAPDATVGWVPMRFSANSVVEYRPSASTCEVLGRTVVLTDGVTGADALAAGWWTSYYQVPVLLHDGSLRLPRATAEALATTSIDNLVVLGGTARISDAVVAGAVSVTGARVIRVAGEDRYATSVEMAKRFGGWWPAAGAAGFSSSRLCVAASSGSGAAGRGWPDALGAGPWCGAGSAMASVAATPTRLVGPPEAPAPALSQNRPGRQAMPILLVPAGANALPASVEQLLRDAFPASAPWCAGVSVSGCVMPGFAVAVGGPAVIGDGLVAEVSGLLAGAVSASATAAAMVAPALTSPFATRLDMAPVFNVSAGAVMSWCVPRNGYGGARWLAVYDQSGRAIAQADPALWGWYRRDADGVARTVGVGAPGCVGLGASPAAPTGLRSVGPAGWTSAAVTAAATPRLVLSAPISLARPISASGAALSSIAPDGSVSTLNYLAATPNVSLSAPGLPAVLSAATVTIEITRGRGSAPNTFVASWVLSTSAGDVAGTARGEAIASNTTWQLRGRAHQTGTVFAGGFSANIAAGEPNAISWNLDLFG